MARILQLLVYKEAKMKAKVTKINQDSIESKLAYYKVLQENKSKIDKELKLLKDELLKSDAGQYGQYMLAFETREVREYLVPARIDTIVKVNKI
jgi:hypothetical protein